MSVLVVDDEPIFRTGLKTVLERSGVEISGDCPRRLALELSEQRGVKIALLVLRVDDADGLNLVSRLTGLSDPPTVVIVMTRANSVDALTALRAGASGLVLSDCEPHQLSDVVLAAAQGRTRLSPQLAEMVVAGWTGAQDSPKGQRPASAGPSPAEAALTSRLSRRERDVLSLLSGGLSNPEIATRLTVSTDTVKGHISSIYTKIGTRNRVTAAVLAWRWGLASGPVRGAANDTATPDDQQ
jgi:DNA-binding NarL/FixJ family response regulator